MALPKTSTVIDLESSDDDEPATPRAPPKAQPTPRDVGSARDKTASSSNRTESAKQMQTSRPLPQSNPSKSFRAPTHDGDRASHQTPFSGHDLANASSTQPKSLPKQSDKPRIQTPRTGAENISIDVDAPARMSHSREPVLNKSQNPNVRRHQELPGSSTNRSVSTSFGNLAKRKAFVEDGTSFDGRSSPAKRPKVMYNSQDSVPLTTSGNSGRRQVPRSTFAGSNSDDRIIDLTKSISPEPESTAEKNPSWRPRPKSPLKSLKPISAAKLQTTTPSAPSPGAKESVAPSIEHAVSSGLRRSAASITHTANDRRDSNSSRVSSDPKSSWLRPKGSVVGLSQGPRRCSLDSEGHTGRSTIPESPQLSPTAADECLHKDAAQGRVNGPSISGGLVSLTEAQRTTSSPIGATRKSPLPGDASKSAPQQGCVGLVQPAQSFGTPKAAEHDSDGDTTYGSLGSSAPQEQHDPAANKSFESRAPSGESRSEEPLDDVLPKSQGNDIVGTSKESLPGPTQEEFEQDLGLFHYDRGGGTKTSVPVSSNRTGSQSVPSGGVRELKTSGKAHGTTLQPLETHDLDGMRKISIGPQDLSERTVIGLESITREELGNKANPEPKGQTAFSTPKTSDISSARGKASVDDDMTSTGFAVMKSNTSAMETSRDAERVVGTWVEAMRSDNEYWARQWLKDARCAIEKRSMQVQDEKPTSVFSRMKPIRLEVVTQNKMTQKKRADADTGEFSVQLMPANPKMGKIVLSAKCTMVSTDALDVPAYSHYVSIGNNFLAHNEKTLQNWPYFGDDFNMDDDAKGLKAHFYVDVDSRLRKLSRLGEAENFAQYAQRMLDQAGCTWSDMLHFLLEPVPDVGLRQDAKAALKNRDAFCKEDFVRGGKRWTTVLSKLPAARPENVGRAAMLCDSFERIAKFPFWHTVRSSKFTRDLLREDDEQHSLDELTCRICMRYSCPYHGEIRDAVSPSDNTDDEDIVETDIIHPPAVNFRTRVDFPPSVDTMTMGPIIKDPRNIDYWQKGLYHNLHYRLDERGPFYPCHHPGIACDEAGDACSCNRDKVPCEKICGCSSGCPRKFQGCSCCSNSAERKTKGQRLVCFEDEKCVCFQLGRECDPDLCGDCGVCDVLDPLHKHKEGILEGRCRNANIQRGIPKHTILGDSGVHGLGLYACEDIHHHDFVGEYKGEIIMKDEAERRGAVYEHQKLSYLFSLNDKQEIDSTYFGNKIRFINHADKAHCNLYPRIIMVNTVHRIALYGSRAINAGEELFFDYGPMFPNEQLGGKANKKAAPRVRNSNLVHQFWDVEETEDKHGNLRAVKKASTSTDDGDSSSEELRIPARGRPRSVLAKKSGQDLPKPRGGARAGAGRPSKGRSRIREVDDEDEEGRANASDANGVYQMKYAEHRLRDYNIVSGEDDAMDVDPRAIADDKDDDDYELDKSESEYSGDETEPEPDDSAVSRALHASGRPRGQQQRPMWKTFRYCKDLTCRHA